MQTKFIHKLFEQQADKNPERIAIEECRTRMSYAELNAAANQCAHLMLGQAEGQGKNVFVLLPPGAELVVALLGVMKAGAVFLPIDTGLPVAKLKEIFKKHFEGLLITNSEKLAWLMQHAEEVGFVPAHTLVADEARPPVWQTRPAAARMQGLSQLPAGNPQVTLEDRQGCYIFFTSGSTGNSKAILGNHQALAHFIQWEAREFAVDESFRVSQLVQITFDASLRDMLLPLCCGGVLCIPPARVREDIRGLIAWIDEKKITLVHTVPSMFRVLTREMGKRGTKAPALPALRHLILSGEMLYAKDLHHWREKAGDTTEIVNFYGATESTMIKTFHRIGEIPADPSQLIHAGKPIADTFVIIAKNGRLCRIGEVGDVYIKTPYLSNGYVNDPVLTATIFVQNPLVPHVKDIVYKTGDLGRYLKNREVEILGRTDSLIKINGIRVELREVETAILQQEGIEQAVVLAHKNDDNLSHLLCYYTGKPQEDGRLRTLLRAKLVESAIPGYFCHLDAFPLGLNGKLDRSRLPAFEVILRQNGQDDFDWTAHPAAQALRRIWGDVLGIDDMASRLSFFQAGGNSLKALQLAARIREKFRMDVSIADIFTHSTIAEQLDLIRRREARYDYPEVVPIPESEFYETYSGQKRLWLLQQYPESQTAYNMHQAFRLRGPLREEALENALHALVARHEILRTTFCLRDGEVKQTVHNPRQWHFRMEKAGLSAGDAGWQQAEDLANAGLYRVFDLERGPLLTVVLIQVAEEDFLLALTMHHIISDGWSMEVMTSELVQLYNAFAEGRPSPLVPLKIQYRDYARWHNRLLESPAAESLRQFWRNKFAGPLPELKLPLDFPRPPVNSYGGSILRADLPPELSCELRALASDRNTSLYVCLLTAVYAMLYRYTLQEDIIIGAGSAGRDQAILENQIGFFINTLAIRTSFSKADTLPELLDKVNAEVQAVFRHQHCPFDWLVADINSTRGESRTPLFNVLVNVQNIDLQGITTQMKDLVVERFETRYVRSRFDLSFFFYEAPERIELKVEYNTSLFLPRTVAAMAHHLEMVCTYLAGCAGETIEEMALEDGSNGPAKPVPALADSFNFEF